jgi:2-amino-4-hydroxy-6-hydroxymethyldihydropteridine diphosphokinase
MRAYVGVGTNLGDRFAHLASAARGLRATPGAAVLRASRVYDTEPLGPPQPRYLNAVLELEWAGTPERLLERLLAIEHARGRRRGVRWGPRTLDLDLLVAGAAVRHTRRLTLPHPGLAGRRFVLAPLAELRPELVVPGLERTVRALLEAAPALEVRPIAAYPL